MLLAQDFCADLSSPTKMGLPLLEEYPDYRTTGTTEMYAVYAGTGL